MAKEIENIGKGILLEKMMEKNPNDFNSKAAGERILNSVFEIISDIVVDGGTVTISNFGTFTSVNRKERTARNVATGEIVNVPAKRVPKFKPGIGFKKSCL